MAVWANLWFFRKLDDERLKLSARGGRRSAWQVIPLFEYFLIFPDDDGEVLIDYAERGVVFLFSHLFLDGCQFTREFTSPTLLGR
jgi:hypothetical protein